MAVTKFDVPFWLLELWGMRTLKKLKDTHTEMSWVLQFLLGSPKQTEYSEYWEKRKDDV